MPWRTSRAGALVLHDNRLTKSTCKIAQILFLGLSVAHEKTRHESKYRIINFAVFGDAQKRGAIWRGCDFVRPCAGEWQFWIGDSRNQMVRRGRFDDFVRNGVPTRVKFVPGSIAAHRRKHLDSLHALAPLWEFRVIRDNRPDFRRRVIVACRPR